MLRGRIDISRDLDGDVVVLACIDLADEEVTASAHAVRAFVEERFRVPAISGDDVIELRDSPGWRTSWVSRRPRAALARWSSSLPA